MDTFLRDLIVFLLKHKDAEKNIRFFSRTLCLKFECGENKATQKMRVHFSCHRAHWVCSAGNINAMCYDGPHAVPAQTDS